LPLALANPAATIRRKIARRLLPYVFLIYMTAFIDRVNVGFAGCQSYGHCGELVSLCE